MPRPTTSRSIASASRALLALVLALGILLDAAPADARKRVVIMGFSGPRSGAAEREVIKIVRRRNAIVPARKYAAAQRRLRAKRMNNRNVRRVARAVQADAVVSGAVQRRRGKFNLRLQVREGASGKVAATINVPLRGPRVDRRARNQIANQLLGAIDGVEPLNDVVEEPVSRRGRDRDRGGHRRGGNDETTGFEGSEDTGFEDEPIEETETVARASDDEDTVLDARTGGGDGNAGDDTSVTASAEDIRESGVDLSAGVSFVARRLSFTFDPAAVDNEPWGYDGQPVPGVYVLAELYPMALLGKQGALANAGLYVNFDRVIKLVSRLQTGTAEFDTVQQRLGVGLQYRINFGEKLTSPTLKLGAGLDTITFDIDTEGQAIDLPDAQYSAVSAGLAFKLPLSESLALLAGGRYLVVLSTGDMETMDNYGGATVNGLDAELGVEWRPLSTPRFVLRGGARYTRIGYTFDGTGAKTNRDADPNDQEVGGALDQYIGGQITAGYLF